MQALCVLVVAAAVAAGAAGGTGHRDARIGAVAAAVTRAAPPALRTAAFYPALHAVTLRPGRSRGARASHTSLPPVALAAGWSLDPVRRAVIASPPPACDRRTERPTRTGSARGPPLG